jgi:hypothetical protein
MSNTPPKLSDTQTSCKIPRILALVGAIILSVYSFMVFVTALRTGFDFFGSGFLLGPAVAAFLCWWFALRGEYKKSRVRMMYALLGGLIIGGIGFSVGFFGPIIFSPQSNQGPLLGIFITGPLGFVAGAIIGAIVGFIRTRKISD